MRTLYGWNFTSDIAEEFIPRLEKAGWVEHAAGKGKNVYIVRVPESSPMPGQGMRDEVNALFDQFETFVSSLSPLFNYRRERQDLENILVQWVLVTDAMDTHSLSIQADRELSNVPVQTPLGFLAPGKLLRSDDRYVCARFVKHVLTNSPSFSATLLDLSSLGLLTELVSDFSQPIKPTHRCQLTIYLDAPIALDYLGLSGFALQQNLKVIIEQIEAVGCQVMVFDHSCDEISRNLEAYFRLPSHDRFGPTRSAVLRGEISDDYARLVKNNPEMMLSERRVSVRIAPPEQQFSKEDTTSFLTEVTLESKYRTKGTRCNCLANVMRLRRGYKRRDIFESRHVLLTRNPQFAKKRERFAWGTALCPNDTHHPSCISDISLRSLGCELA